MTPVSRRRLLQYAGTVSISTLLPGLLAACSGSDSPSGDANNDATIEPTQAISSVTQSDTVDLVRFAWADVSTPTPFRVSTSGPGGAVFLSLIYDSLTWKDEEGIIPWLATWWETSDDGLTYRFQITDGASWHDGQPLTPEDVAFSFTYYASHPYKWMTTEVVESSEVDDSGNVRFTLTQPYAPFLEDIAGIVPIVPMHIWAGVADPLTYEGADGSTGSGPYTLAEYNATEAAYRLNANDAYWRGTPRVREWRQINVPPEARVLAVQQGDIDVSFTPDASVVELLANDRRLSVHETAPFSIVRLAVNTQRTPLDRKEVRQAIAYALDRTLIAETITRGPAIRGSAGVVPPETPWFNPDLPAYEFDPEQARQLLAGEKYTIEVIADANNREPELMTPMLANVGITLNVRLVDTATRIQLLDEGNFQLAITQHIGVGGDPDFLRRWYAGEEANAFAKGSIFDNPEFTRMGEEEAATLDANERREIIFRMQEILAEELPTIVLYHRRFYWVYDPAVFTPMDTWGGLMNGIPLPNNKLTLLSP